MSHTDTGSAHVRAELTEVFAALVDVEARTAWLPPEGMTGRFEWFDPRPGGGYRLVLTYDEPTTAGKSDGNTDVVEVRFADIAAPTTLVEEADFVSEDPAFAGTMTMTWSLEAADGGTVVTITATGVPDGISRTDHEAAFASTLANLDRYLQEQRAPFGLAEVRCHVAATVPMWRGPATTTEEPFMASANPYLNFSGNCSEAFEFYRSVLGGEFSTNMTFADMSPEGSSDEPAPEGIMHMSLPFGDSVLMGSDVPPGSGTVTAGNTCYVCLNPDTPDDARRIFDGLSEGGEIEQPFDKQFWGDYFGSFTDRFGIKWMVDVGDPDAEQPTS